MTRTHFTETEYQSLILLLNAVCLAEKQQVQHSTRHTYIHCNTEL